MKSALLAFLLFSACAKSFGDEPLTIKDTEAAIHIGETVQVRGIVTGIHTSWKDNSFVNMGGMYPN